MTDSVELNGTATGGYDNAVDEPQPSNSSHSYLSSDTQRSSSSSNGSRAAVPFENDQDPGSTDVAPRASLSYLNGLAIVLGLQIGSGIFSAPSQVSKNVTSPAAGLLVWLVSGMLVWTGATCFIELGLAVPQNGGIQEYLYAAYGDVPAFLFTWTWVGISKPSAMALIAMVFSDHFAAVLLPEILRTAFMYKLISILALVGITVINCMGIKTGATVANGFLVLKLSTVLTVICFGVFLLVTGKAEGAGSSDVGWLDGPPDTGTLGLWGQVGNFVTAAYGALFCYGGWETVIWPFSY